MVIHSEVCFGLAAATLWLEVVGSSAQPTAIRAGRLAKQIPFRRQARSLGLRFVQVHS